LNSQLIGHDLEVQRMTDYNRAMEIQRNEMASADDPALDQPLESIMGSIEGVNSLILEHLIDHLAAMGFENTLRSLLRATPEQLATIPGISLEVADKILEQIRKQRT
jgi:transcription termination/antitermination protein NusA